MSAELEITLRDQHRLFGRVVAANWPTRLDLKITWYVIETLIKPKGNSRTALRYLQKATGSSHTNIIASLRRIMANGVFKVGRKGLGKRPTEYILNWDFGLEIPSGDADVTATSGDADVTAGGNAGISSNAPSGNADVTESYLPSLLTSRLTVSRTNETPAGPTAPPLAGQQPGTADAAGDPEKPLARFEELWAAYPRKHDRSKARSAYSKLAPNEELHTRLVECAGALKAHYDAAGTERKYWKHLHNWLTEERYLEDLPVPYENPKDAAIAKRKERGPRKAADDSSASAPGGKHAVEIIGCDLTGTDQEKAFAFSFRIEGGKHDGKEFEHRFCYLEKDGIDEEGSRIFSDICEATKIENPENSKDLLGALLCASVSRGGAIRYEAR